MPTDLRIPAIVALLGLAGASGCSGPSAAPEPVAELSQALNACEETVPANRFVDGLPAYAQCASVMNGAIWSNNGIDTATTSPGAGWVRTQRSGGYQCTEWAWRYMHFRWSIDYQNGNAGSWCDGNLPATLTKATTPVHGDLIVFAPGVCGSDGTTGHIAVIDTVNASAGTVTFVEENNAGRRSAKSSCATCFLHAVANDGSSSAGAGGVGGGTTTGGSATTGGAANGGRAASGGSSTGGAIAGSTSANAGGPATGGVPGAAGAASGGAFPASGGTSAGMSGGSGTVASGGSAFTGGSTSTGGANTSGTASGGALAAGSSSVGASGGAPGASGSPAQPTAGTPGNPIDPISDINSGCSVSQGAPRAAATGWVGQFALALAGFALRRRVRRRRG